MKEIQLTQGQVATVCDCHYHLVKDFKWYAHFDTFTKSYYAARNGKRMFGKRKPIWMHRVINGTPDGIFTDHINHDTLDNQCSNLRDATKSQNAMNRRIRIDNTSGHKGIFWRKDSNKWRVQIQDNGKQINIGCYDNFSEAVEARERAEKELYGEFRS